MTVGGRNPGELVPFDVQQAMDMVSPFECTGDDAKDKAIRHLRRRAEDAERELAERELAERMRGQRDWPAHVRDDAPFVVCAACDRKSWAPDAIGTRCNMIQPNGSRCLGTFVAPAAGRARELVGWLREGANLCLLSSEEIRLHNFADAIEEILEGTAARDVWIASCVARARGLAQSIEQPIGVELPPGVRAVASEIVALLHPPERS